MRSRLIALILIPTVVGILVGGQQVVTSWSAAGQYQRVLDKAELSASIIDATHELALERDLAMHFVAAGRTPEREEPLRAQFVRVDAAVGKVRTKAAAITPEHGESAWSLTRQVLTRLPEIGATRTTVQQTQLLALPTLTKYAQIITALQQLHDQIGQGGQDEALAASVRALSALAKAHEAASQQRGLLAAVAEAGRFQSGELDRFMAARAQQESELEVFRTAATLEQRQAYDDTVTGTLVDRAEVVRLRALAQADQSGPIDIFPGTGDDADRWFEAISGTVDGMWTVQRRLGETIIVRSRTLGDAARHDAVVAATVIVLLLLAVLLLTAIVAQSLVTPLRRLRREALEIAGFRLPATVRTLRETGDGSTPVVAPIAVDSGDEVGEVARAFDEVHREAIRLAGEEARVRANINAMFVNLSRRSQTLVQRLIQHLDDLEQGERDELRLASLFKADHLATRMRRNNENLLVLANQEPPRRWNRPILLADVVRASLQEVEQYQRVDARVTTAHAAVAGQAVNDIVHLVAELIENALSFSPQDSRVTVGTEAVDGGVILSITDAGIGMTTDELAHANERLTHAVEVDVSVSRRMGLFVVARLARRHGIRVGLRPHERGGLIAMVLVPDALLRPAPGPYPVAGAGQTFPTPQPDSWNPPSPPGSRHPASPPGAWNPPAPASPWNRPAPAADWPSFTTDPGPGLWPSFATDAGPGPAVADAGPGPAGGRHPGLAPVPDPPAAPYYDVPRSGTGPIPAIRPVPADDYLPIFAEVESAWFDRSHTDSWSSPQADAGWSAAQAAANPSNDGATTSGLPKRIPKANLVPGTADTLTAPKGVAPIPHLSPERARSRLTSFQEGFRQARTRIGAGDLPPLSLGGGIGEEGP
ncbi:nitrate- and nitrite sensing domain-containing protein [Nonomuraea sp. NPDC049480]|uniref:sensor histidine kinase n=1 Tax=Nonomuraea sp. NPDC049480 TaxID=3364353 RepID=UPI0037A9428E